MESPFRQRPAPQATVGFVLLACLAFGRALLADIAPDPGYVETCTVEKQQSPTTECVDCGTYYAEPKACEAKHAGEGYDLACRTAGASVWREVWCRPKAGARPNPGLAANSLFGRWRQVGPASCENGKVQIADDPIQELELSGESFSVTWQPFETYRDYWGPFRLDAASGKLTLEIKGGNNVPGHFVGEGRVELAAAGQLQLIDFWLGRRSDRAATDLRCTYVFERF